MFNGRAQRGYKKGIMGGRQEVIQNVQWECSKGLQKRYNGAALMGLTKGIMGGTKRLYKMFNGSAQRGYKKGIMERRKWA